MSEEIRVPLVEPGSRPELAELERSILAARGRISPLYQALLNSPPIAGGWEKLLTAVRNQTAVPPSLRELVILRVAVLNRASFEFDAHVPRALEAGLPQSKIEAVRNWQPGRGHDKAFDAFDDDERVAVLSLVKKRAGKTELQMIIVRRQGERFLVFLLGLFS